MQHNIPYDFKAWRKRMDLSGRMAALELYCSLAHYWKMEREGQGSGYYVWTAYGKERLQQDQHIQKGN